MSDLNNPTDSSQSMPRMPHAPAHEGLRAGAVGATVVWLWFYVSDWLTGTPLHLAAMFGQGMLEIVGAGTGPAWQSVVTFTIVHFAYWCLLAVIILSIVHAARANPSVLGLGATLFILAQFLFAGLTAIISNSGMGAVAWPSVWLGNFAGWAAAWWLIVRRHPELRDEVRHMNDG